MDRRGGSSNTKRERAAKVASTDVEATTEEVQNQLEETIRMFAAVRLLLRQLRDRTS